MSRAAGKALALDTKIPTPDGYSTMGELQAGDYVLDEEGNPVLIKATSDIFKNHKCYKITFSDGEEIIADANHLWNVVTARNVDRTFKTEEMSKDFKRERKGKKNSKKTNYDYKYKIKKAPPITYEEKELPIDPYVLGYWLGDRASASVRITCDNKDIKEVENYISEKCYTTNTTQTKSGTPYISVGVTKRGQPNYFLTELQKLNLINNKHIPDIYMRSSIEQRRELLKGLMDSDGSVDKLGRGEFSQSDKHLIEQVSTVLQSLGINNNIKYRMSTCNGKEFPSYRLHFMVDKKNSVFKLKRKHNRLKEKLKGRKFKYIWNIEEIKSVPTKCITVDSGTGLFLCGEKNTITHNSTLGAIFIMAKAMLFPNHQTYILASAGSQSQEMFLKMEDIALKQIGSFTSLTDVFANETIKNQNNSTGFTHSPASFEVNLFNGSTINSLNSVPDNIRSKRSNLNFYDEAGFITDELFEASEPFAVQSSDFRLGGDTDITLLPKQVPNQLIYASSASATDTYYFQKYRDFSERMFAGDSRYFVADVNSDAVIHATVDGKMFPVSLLSQETVDAAMRSNKEKAMREYGNIFTSEGGDQQIIKRSVLIKNSEQRPPTLYNSNGKQYVIAIDPARSYDNSIMTIAELFKDEDMGYMMRIVNSVSFTDVNTKKRTPMKTPEQIKVFKETLDNYNGKQAADYENIAQVLIDSGSGGAGVAGWADNLIDEWVDKSGRKRKGLIDKNHKEYEEIYHKYPNASQKLTLTVGNRKQEIFSALREMVTHDLIKFTEDYDGKEHLLILNGKDSKDGKVTEPVPHKLSDDEKLALTGIDLTKEELVNIYEFPTSSGVRYELAPHQRHKMKDDRAYTVAMLAWYLQNLRRDDTVDRNTKIDISKFVGFKASGF